MDNICNINLEDGFEFEKVKVGTLPHPHMNYTGIEVLLLAKLGTPQSYIQLDLGFGDTVEPISYSIDLTSTSKGPLFESKIQVRAYPKEFIFAEKLETVVHRSVANSRMKDFHDLHSLISLDSCLDQRYTEKAIKAVFCHRQTPIDGLPIQFDDHAMGTLQSAWQNYHRKAIFLDVNRNIPKTIREVIESLNAWLKANTNLCSPEEHQTVKNVYLPLNPSHRLYATRLIDLPLSEILSASDDHLFEPLCFNRASKKWEVQYEDDKVYEVVVFYLHGDSGRGFESYNSKDFNQSCTKLERVQLGDIYHVPGYFLNDWNNRIDPSGHLYYWFQPLAHLSPTNRKRIIETAKKKHPYNTFD